MTKKARRKTKKEIKKIVKKDVRRSARKSVSLNAPKPVIPSRTFDYSSTSSGAPPNLDLIQSDKELTTSILQPFYSFENGFRPAVPGSTRGMYRFASRMVQSLSTVQDASAPTNYYAAFCVNPSAKYHYTYATAFNSGALPAGTPTALNNIDDPVYTANSLGTSVDKIRVVAMGVRVRNVTALNSVQGTSVSGLLSATDAVTCSWATAASVNTAYVHSECAPADVVQIAWRPMGVAVDGNAGGDWQLMEPNLPGTGDAFTGCFWRYAGNAAQAFTVEIVTFYEAIPFSGSSSVMPTVLKLTSQTAYAVELDKAYRRDPPHSLSRCVFRDDGVIQSIADDVKTIWGGVKGVVSGFKAAKNIVSTIWDGASSFFSNLFGAERVLRHLSTISDEDLKTLVDLHYEFKGARKDMEHFLSDRVAQHRASQSSELQGLRLVVKSVLEETKEDDRTSDASWISNKTEGTATVRAPSQNRR